VRLAGIDPRFVCRQARKLDAGWSKGEAPHLRYIHKMPRETNQFLRHVKAQEP